VDTTANYVTCGQCGTSLVIHRTPTSLYTTEVEGAAGTVPEGPTVQQQLAEMSRQQQLDRIDRAWETEQQQYLMTGSQGSGWVADSSAPGSFGHRRFVPGTPVTYLPTKAAAVFGGLVAVVGGGAWTISAASMSHADGFWMFGLVFMAFGVGVALYTYYKAADYEDAYRAYRKRRRRALESDGDAGPQGPGPFNFPNS
jgi:hypothetical protein